MIGIYCRISRIKDGNDLSIADQQMKGIELASKLGVTYHVYIDEGLSGASDKIEDRPAFQEFIADVSAGKLKYVYAYDQSRFERNPQIRFVLLDLFKKHKVKYFTHMDGEVDLHDPQAEFFGDLLSVINKYHVTITKIKVKSALTMRAKEGKGKGTLPFGYMMDDKGYIVINEDEAFHVRRAYDLSLKGVGCNAICNMFNEEGINTVYTRKAKEKGNAEAFKWSPSSVRNMITNSFYKGERKYNDEIIKVPAIVTPEYWNEVINHLPLNANNDGKKVTNQFLLTNILFCGVCGRRMFGRRNEAKRENSYACASKRRKGEGCINKGFNITRLDTFIWEHLFVNGGIKKNIAEHFSFDDSTKKSDAYKSTIKQLTEDISKSESERGRAISLVIKGLLSEDDIAVELKAIDKKLSKLKSQLQESQTKLSLVSSNESIVKTYSDMFEKYTEETSFDDKRYIISKMINKIEAIYDHHWEENYITINYNIDIKSNIYAQHASSEGATYYRINEDENEDFPLENRMSSSKINKINSKLNDLPSNSKSHVGDLVENTGIADSMPPNNISHPCV
ncbi:MAG: hypothetical protein DI539_15805 [Flavobacterium psychrophilum]|nr:MAG: hypothetical protein DI539_15805 [Flavobacterium psychrophilum]